MSNDLAIRSTVRELVAAFESAEADIRAAFAMLVAAEQRINTAFTLGESIKSIRVDASRNGYHDNFEDPTFCIDRMARDVWCSIVQRLELKRVMSIARWEALEKQLKDGVLPPITEANVWAFARDNAASIPDMHKEAVGEVYEWLRRAADPDSYSARYKTNQKNGFLELGPRLVLTCVVSKSGLHKGRFEARQYSSQKLTAMENVFQALDGQGMASKGYYSAIELAIKNCTVEDVGRGSTPYFSFRACGNGNLHLTMRRLDLLKQLNQSAGGMRLRPVTA